MAEIIDFNNNSYREIQRELTETQKKLTETQQELIFYKKVSAVTNSTTDLLRLQIADMESNVMILQGHLKMVTQNLQGMRAKLDGLSGFQPPQT